MSDDLERQLGQLSGQLSSVVPALEHVEEKADANALKVARLEQEVSQSRTSTEGDIQRILGRLDQGGKDFELLRLEMDRRQRDLEQLKKDLDTKVPKTELDTVRKEVEDAKVGKKSRREWWWDLAKITLAGLLGAAASAIASKIF